MYRANADKLIELNSTVKCIKKNLKHHSTNQISGAVLAVFRQFVAVVCYVCE